jgi:hypothetical protein
VLPDVDAEQRHVALHDRRVLVRRRVDSEAGAVPHEPGPAAAEALDAAVDDSSLQGVEAFERIVDPLREIAGRRAAAVRAHDLPEEAVVRVAARVVADRRLLVLGHDFDVREDSLDGAVSPLGSGQCGVRVVDVGLVVQVMVDPHRLRVDVWLERVICIRKIREFEWHAVLLSRRREDMLPPPRYASVRKESDVAGLQLRGDRAA